jgi:hypothetical protein
MSDEQRLRVFDNEMMRKSSSKRRLEKVTE